MQTVQLYQGIFIVTQVGSITDFALNEPLAPCSKRGRAAASKPKSRKLWGDGKGKFRTSGKYAAATVRGTRWLGDRPLLGDDRPRRLRQRLRARQGPSGARCSCARRTVTPLVAEAASGYSLPCAPDPHLLLRAGHPRGGRGVRGGGRAVALGFVRRGGARSRRGLARWRGLGERGRRAVAAVVRRARVPCTSRRRSTAPRSSPMSSEWSCGGPVDVVRCPGPVGRGAHVPALAAGPGGWVAAAWDRMPDPKQLKSDLIGVIVAPSGVVTRRTVAHGTYFEPRVAVRGDGTATVAWDARRGWRVANLPSGATTVLRRRRRHALHLGRARVDRPDDRVGGGRRHPRPGRRRAAWRSSPP